MRFLYKGGNVVFIGESGCKDDSLVPYGISDIAKEEVIRLTWLQFREKHLKKNWRQLPQNRRHYAMNNEQLASAMLDILNRDGVRVAPPRQQAFL